MQFKPIIRIIGLLTILFSITMIIPNIVSIFYKDNEEKNFIKSFFITLIIGLFLWTPNKHKISDLKTKESFFTVSILWIILGSLGALPFIFSKKTNISITDAFFESFSGLTTTGATTLINLENLSKSILFYRQMLQWLGGMGIIVLGIAALPLLKTGGGVQLYKAETPGPLKNEKIRPRIAETAKTLWLIYIFLTIVCTVMLWIFGLNIFDAISHSFSIISLGGFSTHDTNIGYFNNITINFIISIFLIISNSSFNLHFLFLSNKNFNIYWKDIEFKTCILFQSVLIIICTTILLYYSFYESFIETVSQVFFQVISISTTAGFTTEKFTKWPTFLPILLLFSSFIGGCSGSVGGGLKVIRILLLIMHSSIELKKLVHPNAIYTIKLGHRIFSRNMIENIFGFFTAYIFIFIISFFILIGTGIDEFSAFTSIITTLNNLGQGIGLISENFIHINSLSKWILIITMIFGRLEIFTLLILFTPTFWKK